VVATKLLHVPTPRGWASLLACVMVVGGVQLLTLGVGKQDEVSHHHRRYRKATLRAVFARAGLPAPRVTYFNAFLLPPIAAVRWLRHSVGAGDPTRSAFEDNRPGLVNDLLAAVFAAERHLVPHVPLPLGVS